MIDPRAALVSANPNFYRDVYAVLVELGGANPANEADFIHHYATNPEACEWRFMGHFGYGGKFYRTLGHYYVNCYVDDHTPATLALLAKMDEQIGALVIKHQPPTDGETP